mmetsp:Transcript_49512/g.127785  ORF Transcript_49512/g.127785 Transcript_49512/m.127785 type:complete len:213 (-) Transcript_49512:702-1340(-)
MLPLEVELELAEAPRARLVFDEHVQREVFLQQLLLQLGRHAASVELLHNGATVLPVPSVPDPALHVHRVLPVELLDALLQLAQGRVGEELLDALGHEVCLLDLLGLLGRQGDGDDARLPGADAHDLVHRGPLAQGLVQVLLQLLAGEALAQRLHDGDLRLGEQGPHLGLAQQVAGAVLQLRGDLQRQVPRQREVDRDRTRLVVTLAAAAQRF